MVTFNDCSRGSRDVWARLQLRGLATAGCRRRQLVRRLLKMRDRSCEAVKADRQPRTGRPDHSHNVRAFGGATVQWRHSVLQLAVAAIMARLLYPAAFGVVAMAAVILSFGQYFAQMGVGRALVQRASITRDDVRVAFTSSVLLGPGFRLSSGWSRLVRVSLSRSGRRAHPEGVRPVVLDNRLLTTGQWLFFSATCASAPSRSSRSASYALAYAPLGVGLAYSGPGAWSIVVAGLAQLV